jgi:AcrR family transcriptional regulator
MEKADIPIKDPTLDLSPTAQVILDAAVRVLRRDGFAGLTFESIAAEAHEHPSLIRYHFGSKAGLIAALVDSVFHLESVEIMESVAAQPEGEARRHALFAMHREIAHALDAYRMYYELIPPCLRDDSLRERLRALFEWYRDLDAWSLSPDDDPAWLSQLQPLSALTVALADGLALQVQADPALDIGPAFDLWESMVRQYLESLPQEADAGR